MGLSCAIVLKELTGASSKIWIDTSDVTHNLKSYKPQTGMVGYTPVEAQQMWNETEDLHSQTVLKFN